MQFKPFYWVGALALMTLVLYSCQKDEITDNSPTPTTENPTTPNNPTNDDDIVLLSDEQTMNDGTPQSLIGLEEIKGSMKAKALIKDIIQETFMQLVLSHDFNPFMPPSQRESCSCPGLPEDGLDLCGCPFQEDITAAGVTGEKTIRLSYRDATNCLACTPASTTSPSGFTIFGEVDVTVVGSLGTIGHEIIIVPDDNFTVDNHDFDATKIGLESIFPPAPNTIGYDFTDLNGVSVTDPNNNTTTLIQANIDLFSGGTFLTIRDEGVPHGSLELGFGLLDDVYELYLVDALIQCSNGEHVIESTQSDDPFVFDMECECIEKGFVEMYQTELNSDGDYVKVLDADGNPIVISTVDYGYVDDAMQAAGTCDDWIQVGTRIPGCFSLTGSNTASTRNGCFTYEEINCL